MLISLHLAKIAAAGLWQEYAFSETFTATEGGR